MSVDAPLCPGGRCSQILAGVAQLKAQMPAVFAAQITEIVTGVLAERGLKLDDAEVRGSVLRHTERVTGVGVSEGVAA